ncbi:O-antigen/teichoic acid export membrane protein [Pontibacter virosus]|uniref:O-antigen/teichoic acid export membrane protein n=1 Tax=Pontibacter virosus TaxID=1765052 RepID=A0A2U1AQS3_9BACT|nr:O-antigen/teichoic acid export membrane protein [Pontibacter virosus]
MKVLVQRIYENNKLARAREWARLLTFTGTLQVLIQALGFTCGILVIRILPTQEYALYTLANTMLGTMIVLADGGIANSVMAQGGKVWRDRDKLGTVLATGYDLRKKFAIGSLLIAVPVLLYLLRHHQASWLMSCLVVLSLIPAFFTALSGNLLAVGPVLHQAILPLKKNEIIASAARLVLLVVTLFIFPWAFVAVLIAGIPQVWVNIRIRKMTNQFADWSKQPDKEVRDNILAFVKRIIPGSIYYSVSGQLTVWLVSIFGSTIALAQIGALGRLSMILGFVSALFGTLIVPRFARLEACKKMLLSRFLQLHGGLLIFFMTILLATSAFPEELLFILGSSYAGLSKELVLSVAVSCSSLAAGFLFSIAASRNWAINPLVSIPLTLVAIVSSLLLIDISTLAGVLKFNLFVSASEVVMYFTYCVLKINKIQ